MTWLVAIGLTNAAIASALACIAWGIGRYVRRPALTRLLWIVVLLKLLAPPLAAPGWLAVPNRWLTDLTPVPLLDATTAPRSVTSVETPAEESSRDSSPAARSFQEVSPGDTSYVAAAQRHALGPTSPAIYASSDTTARSTVRRFFAAVSPVTCLRWGAAIWICGSLLSAGWLIYRSWRFRNFLARTGSYAPDLNLRVSRLAKTVGLRSAPRVIAVESTVSPMLWGVGRTARLLFPAELARRMEDEACDALLLHELAHYARGDWRVRVLELAVQIVYWWHPLVWWARHEIEAAEEECCDAWVVGRQASSRRTYAEALLTTLDFLCEPIGSLPPAACGLGAVPLLRSRLTQIMCGDVAVHNSRQSKALVLTAAVAVLPWGPGFVRPQPQAASARELRGDHVAAEILVSTAPFQSAVLDETEAAAPIETTPAGDSAPVSETRAGWFIPTPLPPASPMLYATAVSPNGKHKLEARDEHRTSLIDVESGRHLDLSTYLIVSASFSPDSRRFVTAQEDDNVVRLWDSSSGELLARLTGSEAAVKSVAFAPDGKRVAAGAEDGSALVWDLGGWDLADWEQVARLPAHDAPVSSLRWSQQGDRLAISLSKWSNRDSSSIVIWRPDDTSETQTWPLEQSVGAIDWLTSDELVVADWDGAAKTIDVTTGLVVGSQWLSKEAISGAFFSPDCLLLPRWQVGRLAKVGD